MNSFTRKAGLISTLAFAAVLFAGAAQADDRTSPPNPNDVAILRGLLALQHPALRQAMPAVMPATATPSALTTEPGMQNGTAPAATEGEACVSPDGCGMAETSSARLQSFRASLERSMAAAGFDSRRM